MLECYGSRRRQRGQFLYIINGYIKYLIKRWINSTKSASSKQKKKKIEKYIALVPVLNVE